jgi:hypothetical protein
MARDKQNLHTFPPTDNPVCFGRADEWHVFLLEALGWN